MAGRSSSCNFCRPCGKGGILEVYRLSPENTRMVMLRPGLYHALIALKQDSVIFEVKDGPWESVETDKTFAPWAPEEGSQRARFYLNSLKTMISSISQ